MMTHALESITRILCDSRPTAPVDGAYVYCTTDDNQLSVFRAARAIYTHRLAKRILFYQAPPMSGYGGADRCRDGLETIGIPSGSIHGIPAVDTTSINTLIESQALIPYAEEQGMKALIVVAPPFHLLRAFMTAVTVALTVHPKLMLYSYPGATLPWMEMVAHSQGTLRAPRRQLIQEELMRIQTYQKKGDLAPFETVLGYMDRRNDG